MLQPSTLHLKPFDMVGPTVSRKGHEQTYYLTTLSCSVQDHVLLTRLVLRSRSLSSRVLLLLPFLANFLFLFPTLCLTHPSRYIPCVCVSPPRRFSCRTPRRPQLSSSPVCRICCLRTHVNLQTGRFSWRWPKTGKHFASSGLRLMPVAAKDVCNLSRIWRPYPFRYSLCRMASEAWVRPI